VILVDLRSGEPFVAHLIGELCASSSLALAECICGAGGNGDERTARENPEFHVVAPGIEE
jgi:hypothetical protein